MAKKKTAPVLRVENPGSGDNQSAPVITKSYCVRDDWKDKDIVNYVAFKSVDGEVQDLTVNGEPAGGGGGFRTITVSVEGSPLANFMLEITSGLGSHDGTVFALYHDDLNYTTAGPRMMPGQSAEFLVLSDSLNIEGNAGGTATVTTSGDVTHITGEEEYYLITGSCKFIVS